MSVLTVSGFDFKVVERDDGDGHGRYFEVRAYQEGLGDQVIGYAASERLVRDVAEQYLNDEGLFDR